MKRMNLIQPHLRCIKAICFVLILLTCNERLLAQWLPSSPTVPSPNASSLGLFTELPVSYFTGVPNISIPLYEVKGNKISLPITLSYNASGLRPEVHPGWVGNGWNLSVGGVITRKANGQIDEYNRPSTMGQVGYYYTASSYLSNNPNWASTATANTPVIYPPLNYPMNTQPGFNADLQPDEFNFNFLGYSGKFFLDQNGQWQVQCDKNIKVTFKSSDLIYPFVYNLPTIGGQQGVSPTFGKFTITDEAGNQYIFGCVNTATDQYNSAIEYSDIMIPSASNPLTSSITATSWYLSEIISADQSETINLNYERGPLESYIGMGYNADIALGTAPGGIGFPSFACQSSNPVTTAFSGSVIFPVYLTKITMPTQNLEIDFTKSASNELTYSQASSNSYPILTSNPAGNSSVNPYARVYVDAGYSINPPPYDFPSPYLPDLNQLNATSNPGLIPYFTTNPPPAQSPNIGYGSSFIWLKLDGFTVLNTAQNFAERTVSFSYNNIPTKRLQLNYILISGKAGPVQNYSFTYNSTPLPAYLSTLTDHWGFNNNNTTPVILGNNNNFAQVRAPDPTGVQTQAEILTGITYPTGGTASFTYEPNTYSAVIYRNSGVTTTAESGIAGGLRIRQIIINDNNGNALTKKYFYVNGYTPTANLSALTSSGVLDSKPIYNFSISGVDVNNHSYSYSAVSSNPIIPLTTSSTGTHIGYTNVVEQRSDGSYTVYNFTNHDNGYQDLMPLSNFNQNTSNFLQSSSMSFKRGKLLQKTAYNSNGNIVSQETTNYSTNVSTYTNPAPTPAANAVSQQILTVCGDANIGAIARTAYQLYYSPFVPISQTSNTYDLNLTGSNNMISATTNNTYDQYKNIIEQDITNSDGTIQKTRYKYAYDFSNSNSNNPYTIMVGQNMTSQVIETIRSVVTNGSESVIGGEVHTYQLFGNNQLLNDAIYNFESLTPVVYGDLFQSSYKGLTTPGQLTLDSRYILRESLFYDNAGNLTSTMDNAGRTDAYLWDYNKSKPVAKIANANNIYSTSATNNPITNTLNVNVPGSLYSAVIDTITVLRAGPINFSGFVYNNPYISGNNSATLEYQLTGNNQYQSGSICTSTPGGTSSCGSTGSTGVINNVQPGTYYLYLEITSMAGFQNYYGFTVSVSYPTYQYYTAAASKNDIAFTSFEYNVSSDLSNGGGNWSGINMSNIVTGGGGLTGSNYYTLTGSTLISPSLNSGQSYIVSYWSKNGAYNVSGTSSTTQGVTLPSGWTYFQHTVAGVSGASVTGAGIIDELRLYPLGAQMSTYTFEPLVGIKGMADAKSQLSYFSYDDFQRLSTISDQTGSIKKAYSYNYAISSNQPVITGLYASGTTITVDFTPVNGCSGSQVNWTDLNTNQTGQSNGGCVSPFNVTVPNTGHTYAFTVTCFSALSPSGVTSASMNISN